MKKCEHCQGRITFVAMRYDEHEDRIGWSPPVDFPALTGHTKGGIFEVKFTLHRCPPEIVKLRQTIFARTESAAEQYARALKRDCRKCGAKEGKDCWNLSRNDGSFKSRPHDERLRAPEADSK